MSIEFREADEAGIAAAVALWKAGEVVAFPTETVYGLGADASNPSAVARIFVAKGRPAHNPLIVHLAELAAVRRYALVDERAVRLAERFWPGPLTLVLRRHPDAGLAPAVSAGLSTVAVRVPSHPVAQALLRAFGGPVAAPSANRSGRLSPTRGVHVAQSLDGRIPLVLDGGRSEVGLESTIVDLSGPTPVLLRLGAITRSDLMPMLGELEVSDGDPDLPSAPGQLLRHYAPNHPIRLDAVDCLPTEAWLGFGRGPTPVAAATLNLSVSGDLLEAASNLFDYLRRLDNKRITGIAVARIPDEGVGAAIRDRLIRAARA